MIRLFSASSLCCWEWIIQRKNEANDSSDPFSRLSATLFPVNNGVVLKNPDVDFLELASSGNNRKLERHHRPLLGQRLNT
jgi:hypothetical protein